MKEIEKIALQENFLERRLKKGKITKKSILRDYIKFNFRELDIKRLKPFKIAIDTGNAVAGILVSELKKRLPGKIYHLFSKLDGSFPNHLPNPLEEKNIKDLKNFVKEKRCDLGVAFDGDGDRIIFVDDQGKMISSDYITCLIAQALLKRNPGAKVLYNICSSNIIKQVVKENGGKPIPVKVGHTFVKEKMIKEDAFFAGEFSGHFYLASYHFTEAPLAILFEVLKELSVRGKSISALVKCFKKYFHSGQWNLKIRDKKRVLTLLEKKYNNGKISRFDGLRIDFSDWWFNARPSNTEDLLRLVVEAKTKKLMKEKLKEIMEIIKEI